MDILTVWFSSVVFDLSHQRVNLDPVEYYFVYNLKFLYCRSRFYFSPVLVLNSPSHHICQTDLSVSLTYHHSFLFYLLLYFPHRFSALSLPLRPSGLYWLLISCFGWGLRELGIVVVSCDAVLVFACPSQCQSLSSTFVPLVPRSFFSTLPLRFLLVTLRLEFAYC